MIIHNLRVLSYTAGFTLWHYAHTGSIADILTPSDFFRAADTMLQITDRIMVSATDGAADLYVLRVEPLTIRLLAAHQDREND